MKMYVFILTCASLSTVYVELDWACPDLVLCLQGVEQKSVGAARRQVEPRRPLDQSKRFWNPTQQYNASSSS